MAEARAPWLMGLAAMAAVVLSRGGSAPSAQPSASSLAAPAAAAEQALSLSTPAAAPRTHTWGSYKRLYQEFFGKGSLPARRPELRGGWGGQRVNLRVSPPEPEVTPEDLDDIREWARLESYDLDFMVALVPDPIDSRLPSSFDLTLAGLQMSLSQAKYILDRKWLPWPAAEVSPDPGQEAVAQQTAGLMLFRRVNKARQRCLLALFLVGETPARGIHREAFTQAVQFIKRMQHDPEPPSAEHACRSLEDGSIPRPLRPFAEIRVLGPSFSGSSGSLSAAIRRLPDISFHVVTGTATATEVPQDLTGLTNERRKVLFSRTVVPDDILRQEAYRFMTAELGWDLRYAALLAEADTVYGEGFTTPGTPGKNLPFPSGLSAIRDAWEENGAAKGAGSAKEPVIGRKRPALDISLADPGTQADGVRELSRLTSRIEEMAMANLLQTISRYGIRYVGIVGTDVKDEVFLAEQIRRWSPDVIVFLFESNLIYLHPQAHPALFGSLAITSFPLTNNGLTIPRKSEAPVLMFGSEVQEGVYRAMQCLLGRPMEPPAVWLAATGDDTMSPVGKQPVDAAFMEGCPQTAAPEPTRIIPLPEVDDVQLLLLMIAIGVMAYWLGNHAYLPDWPESGATNTQATPRTRANFDSAARARSLLILGEVVLCFMGAGLLALALLPVWARDFFHPWEGLWESLHPYLLIATVAAYAGPLLCLAQALTPNAASAAAGRARFWHPRRSIAIGVTLGGFFACLAIHWSILHWWSLGQPGFFYLRARRFANGLSPCVSLGWLGAAFVAWIALEMKRQQIDRRQEVAWPLSDDDEPALGGCAAKANSIAGFLAPIRPPGPGLGLVAAVAIIVAAFLCQTAQPLADPRWYGCLFVIVALFAFLLSVASFYRFLKAWRLLRELLWRLEHCSCRRAFAGIAATVQWNAMKSFILYTPSFRSLAQLVEGLKEVERKGFARREGDAARAEERLKEAFEAAFAERFAQEVEARQAVAEVISDADRRALWRLAPEVQALRALRVVAYLRHVFGQLRYSLIGAMVPGLLLIVAVNQYTFVPSHYMLALFWTALLTASAMSLIVFVQMDRDVALSEIGDTSPGKGTFDRAFLSNIFTYAALPLLALISSQVPEVGQLFDRWMEPLTRILEVG